MSIEKMLLPATWQVEKETERFHSSLRRHVRWFSMSLIACNVMLFIHFISLLSFLSFSFLSSVVFALGWHVLPKIVERLLQAESCFRHMSPLRVFGLIFANLCTKRSRWGIKVFASYHRLIGDHFQFVLLTSSSSSWCLIISKLFTSSEAFVSSEPKQKRRR